MTDPLRAYVAAGLDAVVAEPVRAVAARLAGDGDAVAVLFYGSNLRTRSLDGVLDFYVLTEGPAERGLWPTVSYREWPMGGQVLRAKIATMRAATFRAAAGGAQDDPAPAREAGPGPRAQCASAQFAPCPASTIRGTSRRTAGSAAPSITARAAAISASTAPSSTSKTSSSWT